MTAPSSSIRREGCCVISEAEAAKPVHPAAAPALPSSLSSKVTQTEPRQQPGRSAREEAMKYGWRRALSCQALGSNWLPVPAAGREHPMGAEPRGLAGDALSAPSLPALHRALHGLHMENERLSTPSTTATVSPSSCALKLLSKIPAAQAKSHSEPTGCPQYGH